MFKNIIAKIRGEKKITVDQILNIKLEELSAQLAVHEIGSVDYYQTLQDIEDIQMAIARLNESGVAKKKKRIPDAVWVSTITTVGGLLATMLILKYEDDDNIMISASKGIATKMLGR